MRSAGPSSSASAHLTLVLLILPSFRLLLPWLFKHPFHLHRNHETVGGTDLSRPSPIDRRLHFFDSLQTIKHQSLALVAGEAANYVSSIPYKRSNPLKGLTSLRQKCSKR